MSSLVTGIGFIGSRLVGLLLDRGETVVGLDNLFSTDREAIRQLASRPGFTFLEGDVADEDAVRRAFDVGDHIDTVYHLAAQSSSNPAAAPMSYSERANLVGPRVVLEQACASGTSTFIFGGSLQVYGRQVSGVIDESHPYGPILDISHLSKLYVEKLMEMFAINRGLRCVSARLALVYGVSPVTKSDPLFMTAPNKFCRQVARGESMRVDASAFNPTSMIHVDDAARGLMSLSAWPRPAYSAVNLLGETASVAETARLVQEIASHRGLVVRLDYPQGEARLQLLPSQRFAEVGLQHHGSDGVDQHRLGFDHLSHDGDPPQTL
ncbi:MAG TPA: NAD(P)-dependent oxidoreductase, partial [Chloroflexota bacterium]|nr:NAD(P)-dependent oxidoreductase [Chloroflexota bacterium]